MVFLKEVEAHMEQRLTCAGGKGVGRSNIYVLYTKYLQEVSQGHVQGQVVVGGPYILYVKRHYGSYY